MSAARSRRAALGLIAVACASRAGPARAVDAFEIQVYDGTADAPGQGGLEVHSNVVAAGPRERAPGERDTSSETHLTLEPSFGVTAIWELGAYLQTALDSGGGYHYAGSKLRSKLVTRPGWRPHLRLGVNVEVSWLPAAYEPDHWGGEVRPIAAWEDERWLAAFNPILDFTLTRRGLSDGPAFEPAATLKRKIGGTPLAVGLEYYGGFGALGAPIGWSEQDHRLFETVDLTWRRLDLNLGVGEGLTGAAEALVVKLIAGFALEK
jgi:hypothetical protein